MDHVRIDDIRGPRPREQKADGRCIGAVQRNQIRVDLANKPSESNLACRITNHLSESRGWNRNPHPPLTSASE